MPASRGSITARADPKGGAVEHGPRFFAQPTCHHRPEVYAGIGEDEAGALLRDFFARGGASGLPSAISPDRCLRHRHDLDLDPAVGCAAVLGLVATRSAGSRR